MSETTFDNTARLQAVADLGLTVEAVFVPFSRSRNKDQKHKSLNWTVTIKRNGRVVLTTDFSAGIAHCPAYKRKMPAAFDRPARMWPQMACDFECEEGFALGTIYSWSIWRGDRTKPIMPDSLSVLSSLTLDSSVLDYARYEDWAADLGYDPDSRSGESIYRTCLDLALKMRAALGESGMTRLREIFQDY